MSLTITKDDVAKVVQSIKALSGKYVVIGIPAPKSPRTDGPIGNAGIGYVQEYGSPARGIPPRPFLAPGVRNAGPQVTALLRRAAMAQIGDNAHGGALDDALNRAGIVASDAVRRVIRAGDGMAPLAPSTLAARARKKFKGTKPLIHTGQLLRSITYVVRDR